MNHANHNYNKNMTKNYNIESAMHNTHYKDKETNNRKKKHHKKISNKHDALIHIICELLGAQGYKTYTNTEYCTTAVGEIDVYAIKEEKLLIFEAKSSNTGSNYRKATEQLKRAETHYFKKIDKTKNIHDIEKYYCYFENHDIKIQKITPCGGIEEILTEDLH